MEAILFRPSMKVTTQAMENLSQTIAEHEICSHQDYLARLVKKAAEQIFAASVQL